MSRLLYRLGIITMLAGSPVFPQRLELSVQTGHKLSHAAEFSPDGKLIITAGGNVAILWDTESAAQIRVFSGHTDDVTTASFSPDGREVLTGSLDGTVRLWNAATGKEVEVKRIVLPRARLTVKGQEVYGFHGVSSAAFSQDGREVVIGGLDGRAHVWDLQSGRQTAELITARGTVYAQSETCVAFSPDARQVLTSSISADVQLWDVQTGKELMQFRATPSPGRAYSRTTSLPGSVVAPVLFLAQGGLAVTGGRDEAPRLWETATGKQVLQFPTALYGCHSIAISKDGTQLATGGELKLWDLRSAQLVVKYPRAGNLQLDAQGQLTGVSSGTDDAESVTFSPDGTALLIVDGSESASIWDTRSAKLIRTLKAPVRQIASLQFSTDGSKLVANGPHVWDLRNGKVLAHLDTTHDLPVALSPKGDQMAASVSNQLFLFNVQTGGMTLRFESQPELTNSLQVFRDEMSKLYQPGYTPQNFEIASIVFSPIGNRVLTTAGPLSRDNVVRLWDTVTGKKILDFRGHQDSDRMGFYGIRCAAFSPDGMAVLTAGGDKIARLWDVTTGRQLLALKTYWRTPDPGTTGVWEEEFRSDIRAVAFSPDAAELITGGDAIDVWHRPTGRKLLHIESNVTALAVSRQGVIAASSWGENIVCLWDLRSGQKLRELTGQAAGTVQAMAFSPDGQVLASGGEDGAIRLWSVASGALLATLVNLSDGGWIVTDPQGRFDTDSLDRGAPIRWVVSDEPFRALPVDIFMQQFYTPKLLSKILAHDKLAPAPDITKLNRIQPLVYPPSVEPDPAGSGLVRVRVKVSAQAERGRTSGVRDLRLFRDGRMVGIRIGELTGEYTFSGIRLPQHEAIEFSAYAFNLDYVKSETKRTTYKIPGQIERQRPRTFVLSIGVSQNQGAGCRLNYAASDAVAIANALRQRLPAVEQTLIISDNAGHSATKDAIRAALSEIGRKITPDDLFVMSFAGHGGTDQNGVFYLYPSDIQGSCIQAANEKLFHSAIASTELTEWLRPVDAGEMVMILDACFSAASVEAGGFRPGPMGNQGLGQLAYDKRMRILGASQSTQTANESSVLEMGLLTAALVKEGLQEKQADWKPRDGKIQLREWLEYGVERVPKIFMEHFPREKEAPQQPALFDFTGKNNSGIDLEPHN